MALKPLPRSFYARRTVSVARDLLGRSLVRKINGITISGIITETEAYGFSDDPASHAYRGRTNRNAAMFGEVGRAYVYFTYGMHYCVNTVAKSSRYDAGAVLIRAIHPDMGVEHMLKYRNKDTVRGLTDGPAKLTQALRISKKQYGVDLTRPGELFITDGIKRPKIYSSSRIGIKHGTELMWNFAIRV